MARPGGSASTFPACATRWSSCPVVAGHHKYIFKTIDDTIYQGQPLAGPGMVLEQSVKPAANAIIKHTTGKMSACLEEEVGVDILLSGEAPFTLEWELVHDGKRKQHRATDIRDTLYTIKTAPLAQGGEYTLALTSVADRTACRNFLQDDLKISVRRQRPRAAFGLIEGKRRTMTTEDGRVQLPLRLTGDGPWKVSYRNLNQSVSSPPQERTLLSGNDFVAVSAKGVYEIVDVSDNQCHGTVDPKASTFEVDWSRGPSSASCGRMPSPRTATSSSSRTSARAISTASRSISRVTTPAPRPSRFKKPAVYRMC